MSDGAEGALATQNGETQSIDMANIPANTAPALNDAQKLFSERFAENEVMKQFATHEDPFKAIAERVATPVEGLKVPTEESTPEELAAFRKAIGALDSKDGYKFEMPSVDDENLKKLMPTDAPFAEAFAELAAKNNMPESTWKDLTDAYGQMMVEGAKLEAEQMQKAQQTIAEEWKKAHGENAPEVGKVFQKYFHNATDAESQILSTLTAEQVAALGSVVYKRDRMVMSEDTLDTKNMGSSTLTESDYLLKRSELLTQKSKLDNSGKAWSVEARAVKAELKKLSDQYASQGKR